VNERLARARLSLDGLSIGDAFGECFFTSDKVVLDRLQHRRIPPPPWGWTDDTEMAVSIVEELAANGTIDQDSLAQRFARRMSPGRGYGKGAYELLVGIRAGGDWRTLGTSSFRGMGSFGNGAAMRVAPLGAWFADDLPAAAGQARRSAEITHAHDEGIAGAVAVAVATAILARRAPVRPRAFLAELAALTPGRYTREGILAAAALDDATTPVQAAVALGNGSGVTAPDTVPFCLWSAARHADSWEDALWATVSALGDRDTTCAIVGGMLACRLGADAIPTDWRAAREPLPRQT
jgi:ADP-ribosylglycohydrolase